MPEKELKIKITPRGVSVDAIGYVGSECTEIVDKIEAELQRVGVVIDKKDRKVKAEMGLPSSPQGQGIRQV